MKKLLLLVLFIGCNTVPIKEARDIVSDNQKLIERIKNNPSIPKESKDEIIKGLESSNKAVDKLGEAAAKNKERADDNQAAATKWRTLVKICIVLVIAAIIFGVLKLKKII